MITPTETGRRSAARQRLLETASKIFYEQGIHAISVDELIEAADVSRTTFYRHFPGKEELVTAYLQERDGSIRARVGEAARIGAEPIELLRMLVLGIGDEICGPGFRGCPFINAAAEYPDAEHPVRQVVHAHRTWFVDTIADVVAASGHPEPKKAASALNLLRDGAMVGGYLADPESVRESLIYAAEAVVAAQ
jgi:AcrR family transcriptional regulator